jgi:uncharacterized ferritin-like protein (DUF455 family)
MGKMRLEEWGFSAQEIPLGTYIYESAKGGAPIDRLGMLYFFETKNIGRKPERAAAFKEIGDSVSEHDMDFDWADETIHASYGNRWLRVLHELDGQRFPAADEVRQRCERMVSEMVAQASEDERKAITSQAEKLIARAMQLTNSN